MVPKIPLGKMQQHKNQKAAVTSGGGSLSGKVPGLTNLGQLGNSQHPPLPPSDRQITSRPSISHDNVYHRQIASNISQTVDVNGVPVVNKALIQRLQQHQQEVVNAHPPLPP